MPTPRQVNKYKVPIRGDYCRYFRTMKEARVFCNKVAAKANIILTIVETRNPHPPLFDKSGRPI